MRRILLFLAALIAAFWWLRRSRPAPRKTAGRPPAAPDALDPMVRDRVCNTFLPRSRALVVPTGGEDLFFCSETCRDKHFGARKNS